MFTIDRQPNNKRCGWTSSEVHETRQVGNNKIRTWYTTRKTGGGKISVSIYRSAASPCSLDGADDEFREKLADLLQVLGPDVSGGAPGDEQRLKPDGGRGGYPM